jgi:hypothetical protein
VKKLLPLCFLVLGLGAGRADAGSLALFNPGLAQGCTAARFSVCLALTPYAFSGGTTLLTGLVTNYGPATGLPGEASLSIGGGEVTTSGIQAFAAWSRTAVTEIPEPSTLGLLGAGLAALAVSLGRRTRARSAVTSAV